MDLTALGASWLSALFSSFALIALAEMGDKSQLVCMTLAARHRRWPVLLGAGVAFALLNLLAVLFGAGIAAWIPERIAAGAVALLFLIFGIHALRSADSAAPEPVETPTGHGIFVATLLLVFVAEFGDKTQIAVAGLAGTLPPLPVWIGATAALLLLAALAVWIGSTWLKRLLLTWLHRASGVLFLLFALFAGWRAVG